MSYVIKNIINGQPVGDSKAFGDIYNPAAGKVIGQVAFASTDEVNQAVAVAKDAFPDWSSTTPLRRARVLFKFKDLLEQHIDEIAEIVTREHGKVIADSKGSIQRGLELVEFACGAPNLLKGDYSENVGTDIDSFTMRQPLGVCVGITPFNFPVMIPVWMFAQAIVCGNTFVLKPSERDPTAPQRLVELMHEAGLPPGVLNLVNGQQPVVDQLLQHPDIAAVSFVGSTPVAEHIYRTGTQHNKRTQAFGGAKNHCVVMPDMDLDEAAKQLTAAAYGSAGERCMAISVAVAVGDAVADGLVERIQQEIAKLNILPGADPKADLGPLVTQAHWQKVHDLITGGEKEGAQLVVDGRNFKCTASPDGFFMGPCLFDHVKQSMEIYQAEIFGPVLCIARVPNFNAALDLINQNKYGNGTAIFTHDGDVARTFASRVEVGMVGINIPIPVPVAYHSFGGWKNSMFGDVQMHGPESIQFYTRRKTITQRWPRSELATGLIMPTH